MDGVNQTNLSLCSIFFLCIKFNQLQYFLAEFNLASEFVHPLSPPVIQTVRYYEMPNGVLRELGVAHLDNLEHNDVLIYGIKLNGIVHPICDGDGRRVVRLIREQQTIPLQPELAREFGFDRPPWNRNHKSTTQSRSNNRQRNK